MNTPVNLLSQQDTAGIIVTLDRAQKNEIKRGTVHDCELWHCITVKKNGYDNLLYTSQ